jgi:Zn-finger in ubiquitin-hydrolases and other protein
VYGAPVQASCPHIDQIADVGPGATVCESCASIGGTWLNLRQCRVCGRTGCCDSSPNKHATAHFNETGHPIIRSLEVGHDWSWCYVCRMSLRQDDGGQWQVVDSFFEAGLHYAREFLDDGGSLPFTSGATPDGFPLSVWETTYRGRHRAGTIDVDQAAELEALPGWRW